MLSGRLTDCICQAVTNGVRCYLDDTRSFPFGFNAIHLYESGTRRQLRDRMTPGAHGRNADFISTSQQDTESQGWPLFWAGIWSLGLCARRGRHPRIGRAAALVPPRWDVGVSHVVHDHRSATEAPDQRPDAAHPPSQREAPVHVAVIERYDGRREHAAAARFRRGRRAPSTSAPRRCRSKTVQPVVGLRPPPVEAPEIESPFSTTFCPLVPHASSGPPRIVSKRRACNRSAADVDVVVLDERSFRRTADRASLADLLSRPGQRTRGCAFPRR